MTDDQDSTGRTNGSTRERWQRIEAILDQAIDLRPDERAAFLDGACGDERELRSEVEALLAADGSGPGFLEEPAGQYAAGLLATTEVGGSSAGISGGQRVGPYRLLQRIGEGGMGEVYLAEQDRPVRRRVALKIIKRGMDTDQVIARFEAERQALAMMNHPNVAKVFDAGSTARGRPYFAMEYVEGVPVTEFCDRHRLTTKERLELFLQVCEGIQHAHQNAIIHRDIKPSNVLVATQDGKRIPKIIDFGVAKATAQRLTERTIYTELGQLIGTPEYMSPEQAEMTAEAVDTRTDVYSLGVLLYELLVGALPFDPRELRRAGFDEIRRKIREEEPSKPSTRISTLGETATGSALNRRTDPASLARQLQGDLDWITMKALEKDRTRRYGSPNEFAADIGKHLKHEPVLASPPSTAYRMSKFVRRHRVGVTMAVAAFLFLVGFAARERIQANRIVRERDRANQVSEFQADMLGEVDPERLGNALLADLRERVVEAQRRRGATDDAVEATLASFEETMRGVNSTDAALRVIDEDILDRAGRTIEERFGDRPLIAARLRHTIGQTYRRLGLYDQAAAHSRLAVETRRRELGDDHPDTLRSMNNLANLYENQGRYDEAEPLFLMCLEAQRRLLGREHPDTLNTTNDLAILYWSRGAYERAEPLYSETLELRRLVLGNDDPATLKSMSNLAGVYWRQGRYAEAERLLLEALGGQRRSLGKDHPITLRSMTALGNLYYTLARYDEAKPVLLETLEMQTLVLGRDHPSTLATMNGLASVYSMQSDLDSAESLYAETLEIQSRVLGEHHPDTAVTLHNLAGVLMDKGEYERARLSFERAERIFEDNLEPNHPYIVANLEKHAELLRKIEDDNGAAVLETRAKAIREEQ